MFSFRLQPNHLLYRFRGPLEAPSRGITLSENDAAYRCNLITEKTVQSPVFPFGAATTINLCHRFAADITSNFEFATHSCLAAHKTLELHDPQWQQE
jgi:2,3-bisphosphoglycerate-independent phosphoglycerate mutase